MARGVEAVARLKRRDLVRRRTDGDQDRTFTEMFIGPTKCVLHFSFAHDHLFRIEMKYWHQLLSVCDLLQRRLRATAGEACRRSAYRRARSSIRRIRFDFGRSDQRAGKTEPEAGCADGDAMIH